MPIHAIAMVGFKHGRSLRSSSSFRLSCPSAGTCRSSRLSQRFAASRLASDVAPPKKCHQLVSAGSSLHTKRRGYVPVPAACPPARKSPRTSSQGEKNCPKLDEPGIMSSAIQLSAATLTLSVPCPPVPHSPVLQAEPLPSQISQHACSPADW